ncbi:Anthranilate synthase component 1 [Brevundimonas diminuta]|jgi:anthranilate synthase component 1|uniref:Anthranilate synthase component 1 n=1 Tax=Brevundimonas diminuta TaxID=293 RepID=A0A246KDP3_BREDI|nr:anthranilate synthase component I [Brevundimonas diminuta]EGF94240.1 anthranilate synthase component I [Brevundimonas diminuta ATCC 11568]MBD3572217.1 anthranilate synthase component I [Brevundimonas diminuta]OWR20892.1 anthranilate synthase component I [Brevundimonas diminuta]QAT14751.1 anthranilate synthase component I [Brevundimonas diminuta]QQB87870.1 anthranilate synthase component I [Brevundimonas diminuta]
MLEERDAFIAGLTAGRPQVLVRRLVDDLETPVSAFLKVGHGRRYASLFESVEGGAVNGRYSFVTLSPDVVWRCRDGKAEIARGADVLSDVFTPEDRPALESLRALIAATKFELPADLPPMAAGLFGVFGYDMVRLLEPLGAANPDPLDLSDAVMARPALVAIFDSVKHEIVLIAAAYPDTASDPVQAYAAAEARLEDFEDRLRGPLPIQREVEPVPAPDFHSPVDEAAFGRMVARAKDYIAAGDIFQVVLAHRFSAPWSQDPFAFYRSLRRGNPSPYLFFLDYVDFQLAGSSPEILVRLKDGRVTIRPLAGTRPRGATAEQDKALEAELLADPKERAEHLMLLDLGRNDVGRVSKPGSVEVTESFVVERYSQVMHIVSNVNGAADPKLDAVDTLLAALPAGTLSGAPKVRAMEVIDELETEKRGVGYGGGVGYISANGEADICIVLRTAMFAKGQIFVQAGAGVVADSDPAAEYAETLAKARAPMKAAAEAWRFTATTRGQGAGGSV